MIKLKNKTILIVEDEVIIAIAESESIKQFGYKVIIAHNGDEAVKIATSDADIDLVLMDIDLGAGIDGTETARRILEKKNLPIVFNTSHLEKEMVDRVRGITRYGYIIKNSGNFVLQSSIEMAFELFKAHEKMRESELHQRILVQTIPDLIWLKDADGVYLACNHMFELFFGAEETDIVGKTDYDFVDKELADFFREHDSKAMAAGKPSVNEEWISFASDGHSAMLETIKTPMIGMDGKLIGVLGIGRDITERKEAEKNIMQERENFYRILEIAPVGLMLVNTDLVITQANGTLGSIVLRELSEIIGRRAGSGIGCVQSFEDPLGCGFSKYCRDCILRHALESAFTSGKGSRGLEIILTLNINGKSEERYLNINVEPININMELFVIIAIDDITVRSMAEKTLLAAETRYRIVADNTYDWEFLIDTDYRFSYCSLSCDRITSHTAREFENDPDLILQILHPDDRQSFLLHRSEALDKKKPGSIIFRIVRPDGTIRWIEHLCQPVYDDNGNFIGERGSNRDITGRIKIEEEIKNKNEELAAANEELTAANEEFEVVNEELTTTNEEFETINEELIRSNIDLQIAEKTLNISESRLKKAQEMAHVGNWEFNISTGKIWGSDEAFRMYGLTPSSDNEMDINDVEACIPDKENVHKSLMDLINEGIPYNIEIGVNPADGSASRVIHSIANCIKNEKGAPVRVVGVIQDITERKRLENDRLSQIKFFENMDMINLSIQRANDLDKLMSDVLEIVLSIFDSDRSWLFYPCDPDAPFFRVPMEITKPEYPGAKILNVDIPMSPDLAQNLLEALESDHPVIYTVGSERPINKVTAEQFGVQSQMFVSIYPKIGKPWVFGMHQCSYARIWTSDEEKLFQEIGRRLGDALSSLLILKDLKNSEQKLLESNQILELLIKEMQHRMKNTLGIVSGFLSLEMDKIEDMNVQSVFQNTISRIQTIGQVYHQLYNTSGLDKINLKQYIQEMSQQLLNTYMLKPEMIKLSFNLDDVTIDMKRAMNIGLILNELLTNAMKYAFPSETEGVIRIELIKKDNNVILVVSDDGKGLSTDSNTNSKKGLGLQIVELLAAELGGELTISSKNGTIARLEITL